MMDSFGFCNIKAEKANARIKQRRLKKITALFRLIEMCIFLILFSRFTTHQLPVVFKLSGEYFKGISLTAVFGPRFVFILGNVIVIVLFFKSGGQLSGKKVVDDDYSNSIHRKVDFYDEYVRNCQKNRNLYIREFEKYKKQSSSSCTVVIRKKEAISSDATLKANKEEDQTKKKKTMNRSQSVNLQRHDDDHHHDSAEAASICRELKRSVTEINLNNNNNNGEKSAAAAVSSSYSEDRMSSEEFRRTIEAFIARHQRNLRDEEFSVSDSSETFHN